MGTADRAALLGLEWTGLHAVSGLMALGSARRDVFHAAD